ncbi:MAG TPA: SCO family protein [Gaiellaceae bacterium]|nr:SCO family protein [Gaiellaceae bacterium]
MRPAPFRSALLAAVVAALVGATAAVSAPASNPHVPGFHGYRVLDPVASDFALRDQNGSVVRLSAQHGKLVLLTFLYTNCPNVCPLIASNLGLVLHALPVEQRRQVSVIAVSVDPAHDTRSAVRRFVAEHRLPSQFHYLIGSADELKPIWQAYNLLIDVKSVELVSHTAYVLLLDRSGKPRLYYPSSVTSAALLHDVKKLLAQ